MSAPLSNKQKFYLSKDARRAWLALGKPGTEEEFRRAEVAKACGANGLRDASNADYLPIKAWFENLAGQSGKAFETRLREQTEDRRQLVHKIAALIAKHSLAPTYADSIARDRFRCPFADCTDAQILDVLKTIKARVIKKSVAAGETDHREGFAPKRRDKKRKPDPLDPTKRLPALETPPPGPPGAGLAYDPDEVANREAQLTANPF